MPKISTLTDSLTQLRAGHRAWFWICPELPDECPPLLLSPLRTDPEMKQIQAQIAQVPVPSGAVVVSGIASVDASGRLSLGGSGLTAGMLWRLASWTRQHISTHPDLSRLHNTNLMDVVDGHVIDQHADVSLWEGITPPDVPGTLQQTVTRLQALPAGRDAWFWATDQGPGRGPFLALGAPRRDADGQKFARRIGMVRRQSTDQGQALGGVLRKNTEGVVIFTSPTELNAANAVLQPLLETDLGALLEGAQVVQVKDGRFLAAATLVQTPTEDAELTAQEIDLSGLIETLGSLTTDDGAVFWFTSMGASGRPVLLLAPDMAALKPLVLEQRGSGSSVRGTVTLTRRSWLHFQTRRPFPDFITALAGWSTAHAARYPTLSRLRNARLTQLDTSDEIVERQRNDSAWSHFT